MPSILVANFLLGVSGCGVVFALLFLFDSRVSSSLEILMTDDDRGLDSEALPIRETIMALNLMEKLVC
jgi:hypothetical protein